MKYLLVLPSALFAVISVISLSPASAAEKKKRPAPPSTQRKVVLETYPAMEEMEEEEVVIPSEPSQVRVAKNAPRLPVAPPLPATRDTPKRETLEERIAHLEKRYQERGRPTQTSDTPQRELPYENVPADKTDMIAARLRLVETLLRETGRAYDYRAHTSAELRRMLGDFREGKAQTVKDLSTATLAE